MTLSVKISVLVLAMSKKNLLFFFTFFSFVSTTHATSMELYYPADSIVSVSYKSNQYLQIKLHPIQNLHIVINHSIYLIELRYQFYAFGAGFFHRFNFGNLGSQLGFDGRYSEGIFNYWLLLYFSRSYLSDRLDIHAQCALDYSYEGVSLVPLLGISYNLFKPVDIVFEYARNYQYYKEEKVFNVGFALQEKYVFAKVYAKTNANLKTVKNTSSTNVSVGISLFSLTRFCNREKTPLKK